MACRTAYGNQSSVDYGAITDEERSVRSIGGEEPKCDLRHTSQSAQHCSDRPPLPIPSSMRALSRTVHFLSDATPACAKGMSEFDI